MATVTYVCSLIILYQWVLPPSKSMKYRDPVREREGAREARQAQGEHHVHRISSGERVSESDENRSKTTHGGERTQERIW